MNDFVDIGSGERRWRGLNISDVLDPSAKPLFAVPNAVFNVVLGPIDRIAAHKIGVGDGYLQGISKHVPHGEVERVPVQLSVTVENL